MTNTITNRTQIFADVAALAHQMYLGNAVGSELIQRIKDTGIEAEVLALAADDVDANIPNGAGFTAGEFLAVLNALGQVYAVINNDDTIYLQATPVVVAGETVGYQAATLLRQTFAQAALLRNPD